MAPVNTRFAGWVWQFLQETFAVPPNPQVPASVQPTIDVGQQNVEIRGYEESFAMAVGTNTVILPGVRRAAALNPAALPIINTIGARRWIRLNMQLDAAHPAGSLPTLTWVTVANAPDVDLAGLNHAGLAANQEFPLCGALFQSDAFAAAGTYVVSPKSILVPDPAMLRFSILGMAGTETLTLKGLFLEAEHQSQPLPDPFK